MRIFLSFISLFILIFVIATFPLSIHIISGDLTIEFAVIWDLAKDYIIGLSTGESFYYKQGLDGNPNFLNDINRYFITSFAYLFISVLIAVSFALLVSGWQSRSRKEWMKDIIGFLGMIPDFILVLFLQLATVFYYQTTGERLARIATSGTDDHAILLPIITLTLVPAIYLIRSLSERTYDVLTEEYILTAKAKGLRKIYIFVQHVVRNVLPFLKADLHKVFAIMMSNLFIVEYLFSINGLTALLFGDGEYQFNLTVNTLLAIVLLYILLYWLTRLFIVVLERIFAHD